jgi:catechol 2,3-dioxygenase-like lactoylglutathione lyase family enzyme
MHIKKLRIASSIIEELRKFYIERLGFQELEGVGGSDGLTFLAGYTEVTFFPGVDDLKYHFAFNVRPDQLSDAIQFLEGKGISLIPEKPGNNTIVDFSDWWAKAIYFYDPSGNIVEFIARGAIAQAGNAPVFSTASLVGVSEIGIPVDDVAAMCEWVNTTHNIQAFARAKNTVHFSALGDDEGLLLFVETGRRWFMADFDAAKCPVAVTLEQGGRTVQLTLYC